MMNSGQCCSYQVSNTVWIFSVSALLASLQTSNQTTPLRAEQRSGIVPLVPFAVLEPVLGKFAFLQVEVYLSWISCLSHEYLNNYVMSKCWIWLSTAHNVNQPKSWRHSLHQLPACLREKRGHTAKRWRFTNLKSKVSQIWETEMLHEQKKLLWYMRFFFFFDCCWLLTVYYAS